MVAAALRHRIPSYGFVITEKSSPGRLNTEKLEEIGIRPGPIYGKLKARQKVCIVLGIPWQMFLTTGHARLRRRVGA